MVMRGKTPRMLSWPGGLALLALGALSLPWLPTRAQQPGPTTPGTTRLDEPRPADPPAVRGRPAEDVPPAKEPGAEAGSSLPALRGQLERAKAETRRGRELATRGAMSQLEFDRLEADERAVAERVRQEERRVRRALEAAGEEVEILAAQLQVRRATVSKAQAQKDMTQADQARLLTLNKRGPGSVSTSELQKAEGQVRVADAEVEEKRAELQEAEVRLAQAKRRHEALEEEIRGGPGPQGTRPAATAKPAESADIQRSVNNLKQIGLALHNYASSHQSHFPPPALRDKEGKPGLSWRVAVLPYLEEGELYQQFHLDEPWDSPHNRNLLPKMPAVFRIPTSDDAKGVLVVATHYQAVVGPGTTWDKPEGTAWADIHDGTSNTILVVEADRPVPWTKPDDVPFDPSAAAPKLGVFPNGFNALFGDGSVRLLRREINPLVLRALFTCAGGEVISADAMNTPPASGGSEMMRMMRGEGARTTREAAPAPASPSPVDPQRRLDNLERKLDRLLKEVEGLRLERRGGAPPPASDQPPAKP